MKDSTALQTATLRATEGWRLRAFHDPRGGDNGGMLRARLECEKVAAHRGPLPFAFVTDPHISDIWTVDAMPDQVAGRRLPRQR